MMVNIDSGSGVELEFIPGRTQTSSTDQHIETMTRQGMAPHQIAEELVSKHDQQRGSHSSVDAGHWSPGSHFAVLRWGGGEAGQETIRK